MPKKRSHSDQAAKNDTVTTALEHLRSLEYDDAKQQLHTWGDAHPADLRAWNYLAIATLYQEMFQRGVLESDVYGQGGAIFKPSKVAVTPSFQQELFSVLDKAQGLAEQRLKNDPKDKDAMYWAGVSHGTRATYHFTLRKEYLPALHEATDAYKYHRDLLKLDPTYVDSYLIVGMNNYVVGSLPWYVKAMATLAGRHGDRAEGLQEVKRVTEEGNYAREDAKLMLAVLVALSPRANTLGKRPRVWVVLQSGRSCLRPLHSCCVPQRRETGVRDNGGADPGHEGVEAAGIRRLQGLHHGEIA